jgi:hypothetical protein
MGDIAPAGDYIDAIRSSDRNLVSRRLIMAQSGKDGCTTPAGGPILPPGTEVSSDSKSSKLKEVPKMTAKVGKPAPDFEANGYFQGGFNNFKLSDYKDKWVLLCFYPGDFTFV